jgi:N-acetylmuramoyl-L-alanine amidase
MPTKTKSPKLFRALLLTALIGFIVPSIAMLPRSNKDGTIKKVVIDAGHGGRDTGNLGTGRYKSKEKDISLEVSLMVGKYIKENLPDVEVIYTRTNDTFVELRERAAMANREEADLFISIHCNAFTSPQAYGTETFVMGLTREATNLEIAKRENSVIFLEEDFEKNYEGFDPNDPQGSITARLYGNSFLDQSVRLGMLIQDEFTNRVKRFDRGVKQSVLYVLDYSAMPSVLIELGFLSNRSEEDFLNTQNGKELMASAIYRAFKQYKLEADEIDRLNKTDKPEPNTTQTPKKVDSNNTNAVETKPQTTTQPKTTSDKPVFKIQISTSSKRLELSPVNFNGLNNIGMYEDKKIFKYTYGEFSKVEEANSALPLVRSKGYKDAFVVAFLNGERISLTKAAELQQ